MFLAFNPSFQVCCMAKLPEHCVVGKGRHTERGITLPNCELFTFEISHSERRLRDFKKIVHKVVGSMKAGDNGILHCMAGVHRAPLAGAALRAVVHKESFSDAVAWGDSLRCVEFDESLPNMGGAWVQQAIDHTLKELLDPDCWAAGIGSTYIHACKKGADGISPLCKWNQKADSTFKSRVVTAVTIEDALELGRPFCQECRKVVRCSLAGRMYE